MSKDPATEAGGVNLYAFVANNPVNRNDPFGLWTSGPITDTIMTWVGVSNPLKGQSVGLKVCCGTISIDPIAVDADPSQTLDNYAPLVFAQFEAAAPNGAPTWNIKAICNPNYLGAGFIATYEISDTCPKCSNYWWYQTSNGADDASSSEMSRSDLPGTAGLGAVDHTFNQVLYLYCNGSGGTMQTLATITWSVVVQAAPHTVTLTINGFK